MLTYQPPSNLHQADTHQLLALNDYKKLQYLHLANQPQAYDSQD